MKICYNEFNWYTHPNVFLGNKYLMEPQLHIEKFESFSYNIFLKLKYVCCIPCIHGNTVGTQRQNVHCISHLD